MYKFIFVLIIILYANISIFAQDDSPEYFIQQGLNSKKESKYKEAIDHFETALTYRKQNLRDSIDSLIRITNQDFITALEKERDKNQRIINSLYFYENEFALAARKEYDNIKYGFINKNAKIKIEYKYDKAIPFDEDTGFAVVEKNDKKYLLDTLGQEYLLAESFNEFSKQTQALIVSNFTDVLTKGMLANSQLKVLIIKTKGDIILSNKLESLQELNHLIIIGKNLSGLENIINLKTLKTLEISGEIEAIPQGLGNLDNLVSLEIWGHMENIPISIGDLKNLTSLTIWGYMENLPESLGKLHKLTNLVVRGDMKSIPTNLSDLENLTSLVIWGYMNDFPIDLEKLKNLTSLEIRGNMDYIPESLGKLHKLKTLEIRGNMEYLPPNLERLKNLTFLEISSNNLKNLPENIGNLRNLDFLEITSNSLKTLPISIGNLSKLTSLEISGSNFEILPKEIFNLTKLKYINLTWTKISKEQIEKLKKNNNYNP